MMTLAYIIAIFATSLSLLIVIIAVAGAESCKEQGKKASLMPNGESDIMDTYNSIGISIMVSGFRKLEDVQHLLSLNYIRYEVVVMVDLQSDEFAHELIERFSMVAMDKPVPDGMPCKNIRGVYRSRQRRYHKLVVVDRKQTTLSNEYNCGINLCTHEYIMAIDHWSTLDPDSLQHIMTGIYEQHEDKRVYAIGGFKVGTLPKNNIRIIDAVMRMVVLGAGMSQISKIAVEAGFAHTAELGRYAGTVIVFDREVLIDAGGYRSDFFPDTELYSRIRNSMKQRHINAIAIFLPQVLIYEDGPDQLSASSLPLKNTSLIERMISRRMSTIFYTVCAILLVVAFTSHNAALVEIISLSLAMTYCVTVCVAAISLTVANKLLLDYFHKKNSLQLILWVFLYPFFLLYCLLSPKKFY